MEVNWDDVWWPCDIIEVSSRLKLDKLLFFFSFSIFLWGKTSEFGHFDNLCWLSFGYANSFVG